MSIHQCFNRACGPSEVGAKQVRLPFNTYSRCRTCTWDINVKYDGNYIYYMFGDYVINYEAVNLMDKFNGYAYLGWSGYIRSSRKLEIRDIYVCEDTNYKTVKVLAAPSSNKQFSTNTVTAAPNEVILVEFQTFSSGVRVPHWKGINNEFNFSVTVSCGSFRGVSIQDNYTLVGQVNNFIIFLDCWM